MTKCQAEVGKNPTFPILQFHPEAFFLFLCILGAYLFKLWGNKEALANGTQKLWPKKKKKSDIIGASGPFQRNQHFSSVQWFQNGRLQIKNCLVFDQFLIRGFLNCFKSSLSFCLSPVFSHQEGFGSIQIFICLSEPTPDKRIFRLPHGKGTGSRFESHYSSEEHFTVELSVTQTPTKSNSWGEAGAEPSLFHASQHRYVPKGSFPWHGWAGGLLCRGVGAGESASSSSLHVLSTGLQEKHREEPQNQSQAGDAFQTCILSVCIKENITRVIYNWVFHLPINRGWVILRICLFTFFKCL